MASRCCGPNFIVAQCAATECPDTPEIVIQNVGLTGQSILLSWDGVTANLKSISSANAMLTVTTDAPNNAVLLTVVASAVLAALPQATTSQIGVGETATDAEALAKASTTTFVTPSNFAAMDATQTFAGFIEIATNAEAITGTSAVLALTPANLTAVLQNSGSTTRIFADAVARAGATPNFAGQFGGQVDVDQPYYAYGVAVGQWRPILVGGISNFFNILGGITSINFQGAEFNFEGGGSGISNFNDGIYAFGATAVLDISGTTTIAQLGTPIPANSNLITGGTDGQLTSKLISEYLSTDNTSVYGLPTSTLARTTFATYAGQTISNPPTQAEVQALDNAVVIVSQRLGAVITDLMATSKPHAT